MSLAVLILCWHLGKRMSVYVQEVKKGGGREELFREVDPLSM